MTPFIRNLYLDIYPRADLSKPRPAIMFCTACGGSAKFTDIKYEGVSKSFRTGRLEPELQILQFSATRCSCITIL
jgi:hypothetical protein